VERDALPPLLEAFPAIQWIPVSANDALIFERVDHSRRKRYSFAADAKVLGGPTIAQAWLRSVRWVQRKAAVAHLRRKRRYLRSAAQLAVNRLCSTRASQGQVRRPATPETASFIGLLLLDHLGPPLAHDSD
jgi:hypothetical protein